MGHVGGDLVKLISEFPFHLESHLLYKSIAFILRINIPLYIINFYHNNDKHQWYAIRQYHLSQYTG